MRERYYTTGQFQYLDKRYNKHCSPTAVTNLLCTLSAELAQTPEEIFKTVAHIGEQAHVYWNTPERLFFGGTSDGLTGWYLRHCLAHFNLSAYQVRWRGPATAARLHECVAQGKIIFLQLHFHKKYRQHHVLIYGYEWKGFRMSDGWLSQPVYLGEKDLRFATFYEIGNK